MTDVELERRLDGWLQSLDEPALPAGFLDRFHLALEREERPRARTWRPPLTGLLAAAACLLLLLGVLSHLRGASPSAPVAQTVSPAPIMVASSTPPVPEGEHSVPLQVGGTTVTGPYQSTRLDFGPQDEVAVSPRTRLELVSRQGNQANFRLHEGRVRVRERSVQLAVRTAEANIVPVGTDYEVIAEPGRTHILVWEGSVRVENLRDGQVRRLPAGSRLDVPALPVAARVAPRPVARPTSAAPRLPHSDYPQSTPRVVPPPGLPVAPVSPVEEQSALRERQRQRERPTWRERPRERWRLRQELNRPRPEEPTLRPELPGAAWRDRPGWERARIRPGPGRIRAGERGR